MGNKLIFITFENICADSLKMVQNKSVCVVLETLIKLQAHIDQQCVELRIFLYTETDRERDRGRHIRLTGYQKVIHCPITIYSTSLSNLEKQVQTSSFIPNKGLCCPASFSQLMGSITGHV